MASPAPLALIVDLRRGTWTKHDHGRTSDSANGEQRLYRNCLPVAPCLPILKQLLALLVAHHVRRCGSEWRAQRAVVLLSLPVKSKRSCDGKGQHGTCEASSFVTYPCELDNVERLLRLLPAHGSRVRKRPGDGGDGGGGRVERPTEGTGNVTDGGENNEREQRAEDTTSAAWFCDRIMQRLRAVIDYWLDVVATVATSSPSSADKDPSQPGASAEDGDHVPVHGAVSEPKPHIFDTARVPRGHHALSGVLADCILWIKSVDAHAFHASHALTDRVRQRFPYLNMRWLDRKRHAVLDPTLQGRVLFLTAQHCVQAESIDALLCMGHAAAGDRVCVDIVVVRTGYHDACTVHTHDERAGEHVQHQGTDKSGAPESVLKPPALPPSMLPWHLYCGVLQGIARMSNGAYLQANGLADLPAASSVVNTLPLPLRTAICAPIFCSRHTHQDLMMQAQVQAPSHDGAAPLVGDGTGKVASQQAGVHGYSGVESTAICHCHGRPCKVGSVCGICLHVYCTPQPCCNDQGAPATSTAVCMS